MDFQYFFFDTYIGYFLQVLPIALLISTLYGVVQFRKDRASFGMKKLFSCVFVCYLTGLICLVVGLDIIGVFWYELLYQMDSGITIQWFSGEIDLVPDFFRHISGEVVGNFLMFLPFGVLYPLSKKTPSWKNTVLMGCIIVLFIELIQPIVGRAFDLNDIIMNTLGVITSTTLFEGIRRAVGPSADV